MGLRGYPPVKKRVIPAESLLGRVPDKGEIYARTREGEGVI